MTLIRHLFLIESATPTAQLFCGIPAAELEKAERLRLELSVSLYSQGILGLGKSARLAGLSREEMNRLLAERNVPMHYGPEELAEDFQYGRSSQ